MEAFNFNFINFFRLIPFVKVIYLILDFMFILFLIVVIRQVFSMNTIVEDVNDSLILKFGAFTLFAIAVSLFVATIVIL